MGECGELEKILERKVRTVNFKRGAKGTISYLIEEIFIGSVCCHPFSDSFFPDGLFHPTTLGYWMDIPFGIKDVEQAGGVCDEGKRRHPRVGVRNPRWNVLLPNERKNNKNNICYKHQLETNYEK